MYGTVARIRIKPGSETRLLDEFRRQEKDYTKVPGFVASYILRADAPSNDHYLTAIFDRKESYVANAESPAQDARYRRLAQFFDGEPEWHDGEVVHNLSALTT
jgi:antibiotic biosynthesis monooxygenase (ABM) superfamily enzyme